MIRCMTCGAVFETAQTVVDRYDLEEENTEYTYGVCPYCGSDYITDGQACPQCGEWSAEGLCVDCEAELREKVCAFAGGLTREEIRALDQLLDGQWFSEFLADCERRTA